MISSVFPGEIPGRSRLALLGRRGFPLPGSVTGKADRGLVTKVNLFYNGCVREYGIPARMFNAVRVSLEGKVSGARESQLLHAETLKGLVRMAGRVSASARKRGDRHGVHQKIRRPDNLRSRLARVEADRGIIPSFKTASGQRRYNVDAYLNQPPEIETVCYCRVSSHKQKDDIQRQILPMQEQFPHAAIITDVASGLNWQRKGLVSILE